MADVNSCSETSCAPPSADLRRKVLKLTCPGSQRRTYVKVPEGAAKANRLPAMYNGCFTYRALFLFAASPGPLTSTSSSRKCSSLLESSKVNILKVAAGSKSEVSHTITEYVPYTRR